MKVKACFGYLDIDGSINVNVDLKLKRGEGVEFSNPSWVDNWSGFSKEGKVHADSKNLRKYLV